MSTPLPLRPRGARMPRRTFDVWLLVLAAQEVLTLLLKTLAVAVLGAMLVYGIRHGWLA